MRNRATYKRNIINFIINWWAFLIFIGFFVGIHVFVIFAYIHQWGNPLDIGGLIFVSIIWSIIYILIGHRLLKNSRLPSKINRIFRKIFKSNDNNK